jgi:predicted dienelactone hydrolase
LAVIHVQHPGSDQSVWQDSDNPVRDLRHAADLAQFAARVADVKFILDELQRRQARADPIAIHLDLGRVGMSGHSFGAITTQALAGQAYKVALSQQGEADALRDSRFAGFIAFSPSARKASDAPQFKAITRPFFSVTGSEDGKVGAGLGVPPELRRVPYAGMPAGDKYLLVLNGADHMIFNGGGRTAAHLPHSTQPDPARDAQIERIVRAATTAFWLAYLADDPPARQWLRTVGSSIGEAGTFSAK